MPTNVKVGKKDKTISVKLKVWEDGMATNNSTKPATVTVKVKVPGTK